MNDFLDTVFADNSLRSYLWVAGAIVLVLVLKKYLSRYIAGLLFRLVKKIAAGVDRTSFVNLVIAPLQTFILILVTIVAVEKLHYPSVLDFTIYKVTLKKVLETISVIVLITSFIWLLLRIIDFIAMILEHKADLTPELTDNQLVVFFKDFFKVLIVLNGILLVLKFGFGFNIGSLITALSIGGAAIALATRESLENLIASFIIFFDKPFTAGDLVKVHSVTGTVEKIGLRSTRIRTDQKTFVTVPNKQMVDSILDNLSLRTQRRAFLQLDLDAGTPKQKLEYLLETIRNELNHRNRVENHSVFLSDISRNAILLQVEFFTAPIPIADFNEIRQEVVLSILRMLDEAGIKLAKAEMLQTGT